MPAFVLVLVLVIVIVIDYDNDDEHEHEKAVQKSAYAKTGKTRCPTARDIGLWA